MTLVRCPVSIFCSRVTHPRESITDGNQHVHHACLSVEAWSDQDLNAKTNTTDRKRSVKWLCCIVASLSVTKGVTRAPDKHFFFFITLKPRVE